ncbi:hypothetical protein RLO149_c019780 [Roseobacter litoralis Och 149]|uniref:Uncharacterized protein n=1 Tax=Roseobacter litoralis (strain ATCC 49566 / DSM 6996 / JCM 21268 / NBRC 15278 / OCh 149) TaxID=391595 RepID=F7ZKE5_ROSLO|nr:hypothetical protein RLO149_c019780 [Roseobacter litoralis Och 149]
MKIADETKTDFSISGYSTFFQLRRTYQIIFLLPVLTGSLILGRFIQPFTMV